MMTVIADLLITAPLTPLTDGGNFGTKNGHRSECVELGANLNFHWFRQVTQNISSS